MKVTAEKTADSQVVLNVELEPERVQKALDRAYKRIVNRANIPGFRKGKAPRYVVEAMVGRESLFEEAAKELVPQAYEEAVESEGIDPIAEPDLEIEQFDPFSFKATVAVRPTVELGEYQTVRMQPEEVTVSDEDVDNALKELQERNATWEEPDPARPARGGDQVVVDLSGKAGERELGKTEDYQVVLGSDSLLPGLEQGIIGMEAGQEKEVTVTYPEDYGDKELAGKEGQFTVNLKSVKEKHLPPVDDDLAKTVDGVEDLEQLRTRVRSNIEQTRKSLAKNRYENAVIDAIVDLGTVEMPKILVDNEIEAMVHEFERNIAASQLTLDQYLRYLNQNIDDFRENLRSDATRRVKRALVLREIATREGIVATPEDVDAQIEKLASLSGEHAEGMREAFGRPESRRALQSQLLEEKVVEYLTGLASKPEEETAEAKSPAKKSPKKKQESEEEVAAAEPQESAQGEAE